MGDRMEEEGEVVFSFMNFRVRRDGSFFRAPYDTALVPPSPSGDGPVSTRDILLNPAHGVSVRLYLPRPSSAAAPHDGSDSASDAEKLPLLLYFHGGGFLSGSTALFPDHSFLCKLAAHVQVLIVSVEYRLAPEHPLPAAYHDCFDAFLWLNEQAKFSSDPWLTRHGDFSRCFLGGDSAGGNIVHHVAMKVLLGLGFGETIQAESPRLELALETLKKLDYQVKLKGLILINPFFSCGAKDEVSELERKVWELNGVDYGGRLADPLLEGGEELLKKVTSSAGWPSSLITVADKDILRDRDRRYHSALCEERSTLFMSPEEGHVFHLHFPFSPNFLPFLHQISAFINHG